MHSEYLHRTLIELVHHVVARRVAQQLAKVAAERLEQACGGQAGLERRSRSDNEGNVKRRNALSRPVADTDDDRMGLVHVQVDGK